MSTPTLETTVGSSRFLFIRNPGAQRPSFWRFLSGGVLILLGAVGLLAFPVGGETLEQLSIAQLESGQATHSSWVSVGGRLLWKDAAYEQNEMAETWYVPMVGSGWGRGDQITVFVRARRDAAEDWGETAQVEGMATSGLPNFVREYFTARGLHPADDAVLLRADATRDQDRRLAHILLVFGLLALGGAIGVYNANPQPMATSSDAVQRPRLLGPRASDLAELRGEIAPDDPKIREREDAVQLWMREHGFNSAGADPAAVATTDARAD